MTSNKTAFTRWMVTDPLNHQSTIGYDNLHNNVVDYVFDCFLVFFGQRLGLAEIFIPFKIIDRFPAFRNCRKGQTE